MDIAVLMATFNRKEKTLACLKSLYSQQLPDDVMLKTYVTDDASFDGTPEAITDAYKNVKILRGNGHLYWAGGMRNSWNNALGDNADYYLLLNDDTVLVKYALTTLLDYHKKNPNQVPAIIVGTTADESTGKISYGGHKLYNPNKIQYYNIYSENSYQQCDMANANIMLVPRAVINKIGILSVSYTHSIADFDYTLRAVNAGFEVIVSPGILGYCTDDHGNNWKSTDTSLKERIKYLKNPTGLAYNDYLKFIKTHFPLHLPAAFIKLWLKTLFPVIWDKFKPSKN